jgi:23S rRNA pseudouridine1911/1915/1917 synthase
VRDDGKPAVTEFRVRERFRVHTLVDARLHTGRTHQIRVHLQSIGYPLVGDRRYGARGKLPQGATPELIAQLQGFPRQALHAWKLEFSHPVNGETVSFETHWPEDFDSLVAGLRVDAA